MLPLFIAKIEAHSCAGNRLPGATSYHDAGMSARSTKALKAEYPDKPWMWREDWAKSAIRDSSRATTIGLWVFTLIWNAIAIPVTLNARPGISENPLALILYIFPLVGVIL